MTLPKNFTSTIFVLFTATILVLGINTQHLILKILCAATLTVGILTFCVMKGMMEVVFGKPTQDIWPIHMPEDLNTQLKNAPPDGPGELSSSTSSDQDSSLFIRRTPLNTPQIRSFKSSSKHSMHRGKKAEDEFFEVDP